MSRRFNLACATIAAGAIGAIAWAELAEAQGMPPQQQILCGPFDKVRAGLSEHLGQVEIGGGVVSEQAIVTIFASPDGATWTALAVNADGMACLLASGEDWFPGFLPKKGDPV